MVKVKVNLNDIIAKRVDCGHRAWAAGSFARLCVRMEKVTNMTKEEKITIMSKMLKMHRTSIVQRLQKWARKGIEFNLETGVLREPQRLNKKTIGAVKAIIAAERRKTAKA